MAERKNLGSEKMGQDDDDGPEPGERQVQVDSPYLERLKERLGMRFTQGKKVDHAPGEEPAGPGFVVYGDDGYPIK